MAERNSQPSIIGPCMPDFEPDRSEILLTGMPIEGMIEQYDIVEIQSL